MAEEPKHSPGLQAAIDSLRELMEAIARANPTSIRFLDAEAPRAERPSALPSDSGPTVPTRPITASPAATRGTPVFRRAEVLAGIAIAVVALGTLVWLFRFRYDHANVSGAERFIRTNRISGQSAVMTGSNRWTPVSEGDALPYGVPSADLAKIAGTLLVSEIGFIEAHIYNGSRHHLSSLVVDLTIRGAARNIVLKRRYRLLADIRPITAAECTADVGFIPDPGQSVEWQISSAEAVEP